MDRDVLQVIISQLDIARNLAEKLPEQSGVMLCYLIEMAQTEARETLDGATHIAQQLKRP